jgi:parvulin-like peptidyl-prolyl isomerase
MFARTTEPTMPTTVCRPVSLHSTLLAACTALLSFATAQEPTPPPTTAPVEPPAETAPATPGPAQQPHFLRRRYPQDRDVPVAVVGEKPITLGDLVDHIHERHYPIFRTALAERPEFQRMLTSDLVAPWVRQKADIEALKLRFADELNDPKRLEEAQSAELKRTFQAWLDTYLADRRAQGRTTELDQRQVNSFLADFQLRQGLAAELQGMLDLLEAEDHPRGKLQQFFTDNARVFGGQVKIAHILIQHRDAGTGILLADEAYARATARLADVKARLRADGSNFEEVARLCSEDTRTAREGGVLGNLKRFDERMPAVLCRTAWFLRDGEVSDVVESQYGWHLVKRLEFNQQMFILFTDDAIPTVKGAMRRSRQEDRLFEARQKAGVRLLL